MTELKISHGRGRPPRLERVFQCYADPLYFVTFCTWQRKHLLATGSIHQAFQSFATRAQNAYGIAVGRYVLMPDHLHLFVRLPRSISLPKWVGVLKNSLGKELKCQGVEGPHWQRGFFDHLMRSGESYSEKWEYVRRNPVRAGLVSRTEDWVYQGEIVSLPF